MSERKILNLRVYESGRNLPIDQIKVGDRYRVDMGDIESLKASIRDLGILQPLVLDKDHRLIAGARRLEAARQLGKDVVPVYIVDNLTDAAERLRAERDENSCRKDFTPSEAVAIGLALEALEKPRAEQRRNEKLKQNAEKHRSGNLPEREEAESPPVAGRARDVVSEVVGMSPRTYEKAKRVVEAARANPELKVVQDEMDRTGKVDPSYQEVRGRTTRPNNRTRRARRKTRSSAVVALPCVDDLPPVTEEFDVEKDRQTIEALLARYDAPGFLKALRKMERGERWTLCNAMDSLAGLLMKTAQKVRHV